jgi:hypothetical protein
LSRDAPLSFIDGGFMGSTLEADLHHAFGRWLETIHASPLLRRRPGGPTLRISEDPDDERTAVIWLRERPEIEVFSSFLREIRADVDANAEAILAACLGDVPAVEAEAKRPALLDAVLHLSHSFVLLHELFHVLCGHADELRQARGGLALDEVHLGLADRAAATASDEEVSEAYYRELEADDTAIQWLIHAVPLEPLTPVLVYSGSGRRAPRKSMGLSRGRSRVLSFRVLLVTLWLMIRLFERRRGAKLRARRARHPLPAARLLAAVATALEEYSAADTSRIDRATGKKLQTLDDRHVILMRGFFREVLKPVLVAPWPGLVVHLDDDGWETSPIWIAMESGNLLLKRPAETAPGIELEHLERLRPRMMERLEAYRYFNFNG